MQTVANLNYLIFECIKFELLPLEVIKRNQGPAGQSKGFYIWIEQIREDQVLPFNADSENPEQ